MDIDKILSELGKKRPIFHSEADFQHAFAWEIQISHPEASVRLELPRTMESKTIFLDLWVERQGIHNAYELKYKTRKLSNEIQGELFTLKDQSAQDLGRYDFIKDIWRIEKLKISGQIASGFAIFLTNDSAYWRPPINQFSVDADFRIHEGRIVHGNLNWGEKASAGTKHNREENLVLNGTYAMKWRDYSQPDMATYGKFRYLLVDVS